MYGKVRESVKCIKDNMSYKTKFTVILSSGR